MKLQGKEIDASQCRTTHQIVMELYKGINGKRWQVMNSSVEDDLLYICFDIDGSIYEIVEPLKSFPTYYEGFMLFKAAILSMKADEIKVKLGWIDQEYDDINIYLLLPYYPE